MNNEHVPLTFDNHKVFKNFLILISILFLAYNFNFSYLKNIFLSNVQLIKCTCAIFPYKISKQASFIVFNTMTFCFFKCPNALLSSCICFIHGFCLFFLIVHLKSPSENKKLDGAFIVFNNICNRRSLLCMYRCIEVYRCHLSFNSTS